MTITVINHSGTTKHVPIVNATGDTDEIHLAPKGKVPLAPGWKVCPTYRENNVESRDPNEKVLVPPTPNDSTPAVLTKS